MVEGRGEYEWGQVSSVMALLANINRDERRVPNPFTPAMFNPFAPKQRETGVTRLTADEMNALLAQKYGKK